MRLAPNVGNASSVPSRGCEEVWLSGRRTRGTPCRLFSSPTLPGRKLARVLTGEQVQAWLDAYVEGWRTYDEAALRDLFAPDATYAYHPHEEPIRGRDAIVAAWLEDRDEPGSWEASYTPSLI